MRRVLTVAALGVFTACSGGSHPMPLTGAFSNSTVKAARGWVAAAKKPILFVADLQNNVVHLYDPNTPNPQPEGSITDGISQPIGLAVDSKGALYVNNVGYGHNGITIYSPGQSEPRLTIKTTGYYGIAIDSKGNIFATSIAGTVYGYRPGAKKPFETIGGFVNPVGIAIDSKNNIWVADDSASKVYTIPAGTKTVKDAQLVGLNSPIGICFGTSDTLYVGNYGASSSFATIYHAGSKKPFAKITEGMSAPTLNGITASDIFFQSNQTTNVVGYKKGSKKPFSTVTGNGDPAGIASSPLVKK
jgi:sugar lactone lactonase YvrE